jgi:hypothetical protein
VSPPPETSFTISAGGVVALRRTCRSPQGRQRRCRRGSMLPSRRAAAYERMSTGQLEQQGDQLLLQAAEGLQGVRRRGAVASWTGPHAVLAAVTNVRITLDLLEELARHQTSRSGTSAPVGQRPPTAAEVCWAPVGTQWTFRYPDGRGHLTVVNDPDSGWVSLFTTYPQDVAGLAVFHQRPQVDVPADAERALTQGFGH